MRRNGNRRCLGCSHALAAHRFEARGYGSCVVPGCACKHGVSESDVIHMRGMNHAILALAKFHVPRAFSAHKVGMLGETHVIKVYVEGGVDRWLCVADDGKRVDVLSQKPEGIDTSAPLHID